MSYVSIVKDLWRARHLLSVAEHEFPAGGRSPIRVSRYSMGLHSETILLGTTQDIVFSRIATTSFHPRRLVMNSPCSDMFHLVQLRVNGKSFMVGGRSTDTRFFCATAVRSPKLKLPQVRIGDTVEVHARYTGLAPAPFTPDFKFTLTATIQGPESIDIRKELLGS